MTQNKTIQINADVFKEFEYMLTLHQKANPDTHFSSVQDLFNYVLASIADGSRRPGSWERGMLEQMGLVADTEEHQIYRKSYGSID
jgi:hypothetical protein